eukprot:8610134-Pyramimonas_sp.AAC.1
MGAGRACRHAGVGRCRGRRILHQEPHRQGPGWERSDSLVVVQDGAGNVFVRGVRRGTQL